MAKNSLNQSELAKGLSWAHPLVQTWFSTKIGTPTEPQLQAWPAILAGKPTLISAPTGSGKTLAAFLVFINRLVERSLQGDLESKTEILYVSPLKALSNDIQKNLNQPLDEIKALAETQGLRMGKIDVALRTGDTSSRERLKMLKKPPHILVTTPESLYILLTAEKSREVLKNVKTVIVDEIHALVNNKRGSHLALSLERLEALVGENSTGNKLIRIGLSATQKPIEKVARFLTGVNTDSETVIVNIGHRRDMDLAIEVPKTELGPIASNEMWDEIYDRIAELARINRSTLIFVNTRRLAERVAHHLRERLGEEWVAAHHGSLSRKIRLEAETKLKEGRLKAMVATASLELGIDIGMVDLVCQIGSPRSISVALQRIGRAGHWVGAIPKGRLFATTRDELLELAALNFAIQEGELEELIMNDAPLDILSQQIIASTASSVWDENELYHCMSSALPYSNLSRDTFDSVLDMLSEGIAGVRGRYSAYLFRDRLNGFVKARRGSRMNAIMSGGAIPDNGLFRMIAEPDAIMVGTLDEDFAIESNRGDIVLLGNTSWKINRVEATKAQVLVEDAKGAPPNVPFWRGEAPARSNELSDYVSKLRLKLDELLIHASNIVSDPVDELLTRTSNIGSDSVKENTIKWLMENCNLNLRGASQLIEYFTQGRALLGAVPSQKTLIAERFFDEGGGMQLVIHAPLGARINKAWGLSLRKKFCRSFNFELQAAATDNGINISLNEQHSFPLADVFQFLSVETLKETLEQALLQSPIFGSRWRWTATRSLALLRYRNGKKLPPQILRMLSEDLLAAVFPEAIACQDNLAGKKIELPDHPLIHETMKDILTDFLDYERFENLIKNIQKGSIQCLAVDTPLPSVFSTEILNANPYAFLDDAPLEERRARAVELRRNLPGSLLEEIGQLDLDVIREVQNQAWPDIRDPDELQDFLQTVIVLPTHLKLACKSREYRLEEGDSLEKGLGKALGKELEKALEKENTNKSKLYSVEEEWGEFFKSLFEGGRAARGIYKNQEFWFSVEKKNWVLALYPEIIFKKECQDFDCKFSDPEELLLTMIKGWVTYLGPFRVSELAQILLIPESKLNQVLLRLENSGLILRGQFRSRRVKKNTNENNIHQNIEGQKVDIRQLQNETLGTENVVLNTEWCERRLLARIHRMTIEKLRKEIEPVSNAQFMQWLFKWQHLEPGTQLSGEAGLIEIIKQLQGFELPAKAWETSIFSKRLKNYEKSILDNLTLSGIVGWCRLSSRVPNLQEIQQEPSKVYPNSNTPISFFLREDREWLWKVKSNLKNGAINSINLSHVAEKVYQYLKQKGASFIDDIMREVKHLESELELGIWELVISGRVTADSFGNLRALMDKQSKTRSGSLQRSINARGTYGRGRRPLQRLNLGRWFLIDSGSIESEKEALLDKNYNPQDLEKFCWMVLNRYGVVFRDLLARERIIPNWGELLKTFRRLEDRGEIRGGRFVEGFFGEQFALPYAVDSLRSFRKKGNQSENQKRSHQGNHCEDHEKNHQKNENVSKMEISARDPLNLVGILFKGGRISSVSKKKIVFVNGLPELET